MIKLNHIASTARGLFLSPGHFMSADGDIALSDEPLPSGAIAAAEVVESPPGCPIRSLEVIEPVSGAEDAWQTREVVVETGMRIAVAIGGRYANRSISGRPPKEPSRSGTTLDLLNVGGVAGVCNSKEVPTVRLKILGGVEKGGRPAILSDLSIISDTRGPLDEEGIPRTPLVLIVGSEMDVGKTTCATSLSFSLRAAGIKNTYIKLTGTGRMKDLMNVSYGRPLGIFDSARICWDFVDAGLATTSSKSVEEVRGCAHLLMRYAAPRGEIVLAELADSPSSDASLLVSTDPWLQRWLRRRGLVICACDTLESTIIIHWLRSHLGLDVGKMLISGRVANDPAARAETERMTNVKTLSCFSSGVSTPPEGKIAGGAMSDWIVRNILAQRRNTA